MDFIVIESAWASEFAKMINKRLGEGYILVNSQVIHHPASNQTTYIAFMQKVTQTQEAS